LTRSIALTPVENNSVKKMAVFRHAFNAIRAADQEEDSRTQVWVINCPTGGRQYIKVIFTRHRRKHMRKQSRTLIIVTRRAEPNHSYAASVWEHDDDYYYYYYYYYYYCIL